LHPRVRGSLSPIGLVEWAATTVADPANVATPCEWGIGAVAALCLLEKTIALLFRSPPLTVTGRLPVSSRYSNPPQRSDRKGDLLFLRTIATTHSTITSVLAQDAALQPLSGSSSSRTMVLFFPCVLGVLHDATPVRLSGRYVSIQALELPHISFVTFPPL